MHSEKERRWTIFVCPDCGGGLAASPGSADECDCSDERVGDYPPIDKPVQVMPVSEHEAALAKARKELAGELLKSLEDLGWVFNPFPGQGRSVASVDVKKALDSLTKEESK